jgi:hypothetical protein
MNLYQYHLVDAYARKMIDLRNHESEIKRAFRYVPFIHYAFKTHTDYFEFISPDLLTSSDARLMGKAIAASATTLASMAVKVYAAAPQSKRRTSTQLFKKR